MLTLAVQSAPQKFEKITEIKQIWIKIWYLTKQMWNINKATQYNQSKHNILYKYRNELEITNGLNIYVKICSLF